MTTVRLLLLTVFASSIVGCGFSEKKYKRLMSQRAKIFCLQILPLFRTKGNTILLVQGITFQKVLL